MVKRPISPIYYPLLGSATQTLDVKVKSPWPGQTKTREELLEFVKPEHVLVRKAREGVTCRLICLESESYRNFFQKGGSRLAQSPYFEEVQAMIADFEKAGGKTLRLTEAANPEISFAIADKTRAIVFLGTWLKTGGFDEAVIETTEPNLIEFLVEAFELCWNTK